jgi:hypothetical protein
MKEDEVAELVRYRMEQARATLDDARYLLEGKRSPRSVINRSYYAMFYSVLALLQSTGTIPRKHSGVISLFDVEFVGKGIFPRELSHDLHQAFELRQVSDYRFVQPVGTDKAQALLENAARFIHSVEQYLSETQPPTE